METQVQPTDLIQKLKAAAAVDQVFNAACHLFAMRERSRREVTVASLTDSLNQEGFKASREAVEKVLGMMASFGIGHTVNDAKGQLRALKGIDVTLQSIGKTAIGNSVIQKSKLKPQQAKLKRLQPTPGMPQTIVKKSSKLSSKRTGAAVLKVTVELGKKKITFDLPGNSFASIIP